MNGIWDLGVVRPMKQLAVTSLSDLATTPGVAPVRSVRPTDRTVGSPAGIHILTIAQSLSRESWATGRLLGRRSGRARRHAGSGIETSVTHCDE